MNHRIKDNPPISQYLPIVNVIKKVYQIVHDNTRLILETVNFMTVVPLQLRVLRDGRLQSGLRRADSLSEVTCKANSHTIWLLQRGRWHAKRGCGRTLGCNVVPRCLHSIPAPYALFLPPNLVYCACCYLSLLTVMFIPQFFFTYYHNSTSQVALGVFPPSSISSLWNSLYGGDFLCSFSCGHRRPGLI